MSNSKDEPVIDEGLVANHKIEMASIRSIFDAPSEKIRSKLLTGLGDDMFGTQRGRDCWKVVTEVLSTATLDSFPSWEMFLSTPELSQADRDVLGNKSIKVIRTLDDATRALSILEKTRQRRIGYLCADSITRTVNEHGNKTKPDDLRRILEDSLNKMKGEIDEEQMHHVGFTSEEENENDDEFIEDLLNPDEVRTIPTGFIAFDSRAGGGLGVQDLFIPASHKKGGKSIITLNICANMYMQSNQNCIYIPLEMSRAETMQRLLSYISHVPHAKIRSPNKLSAEEKDLIFSRWRAFKKHGKKNKCRFTIWAHSNLTVPQLRVRLKPYRYNVAAIDYINLLEAPGFEKKGEWERLNTVARDLKLMTKALNMMIMAPTQMNEDGSLRYARGLAEHANVVWTWTFDDEARDMNRITISQPAVRSFEPFNFDLKTEFFKMRATDLMENLSQELGDHELSDRHRPRSNPFK
tara:strand:+ start:73517 stop:74914 length:1398 start_codon:yes stop_codon:yes gene_type:complete